MLVLCPKQLQKLTLVLHFAVIEIVSGVSVYVEDDNYSSVF